MLDKPLKKAPFLQRVERGALCAGCGGCAALAGSAIEMRKSEAGLLRPVQTGNISAETDAKIAQVCPGLGQRVDAAGRTDDIVFGPYVAMHTGWATDEETRFKASSGGALSAVLRHLLASGQIDGVVQTVPDPTDPLGNTTIVTRDLDAITQAAGSRYAPSAPLQQIAGLLDSHETFAFVGKPCDVAAMRALMRIDGRVETRFPFLISFFCAGVPSLEGANGILAALDVSAKDVDTFRYRGHGWPGRATARLHDGTERSMSYAESWGAILSRHVQHRCKVCADGAGAAADIVCADAWHADEKGYPLFEEEDGISLVVARTAKGQGCLDGAVSAGALTLNDFDFSTLRHMQRGQFWRRRLLRARLLALRLMGKPVPQYVGLQVREVSALAGRREAFQNFAGMIKRVLKGRM